jgi:hypothetical protein
MCGVNISPWVLAELVVPELRDGGIRRSPWIFPARRVGRLVGLRRCRRLPQRLGRRGPLPRGFTVPASRRTRGAARGDDPRTPRALLGLMDPRRLSRERVGGRLLLDIAPELAAEARRENGTRVPWRCASRGRCRREGRSGRSTCCVVRTASNPISPTINILGQRHFSDIASDPETSPGGSPGSFATRCATYPTRARAAGTVGAD